MAEAAYAAGDWKVAAELFGSADARQGEESTRLETLSGLGWSQYKGGDLAAAEATFKQVLDGNPSEALAAGAALVRGEILEKLQQPDPALAMFDLVIDKYPKSKEYPAGPRGGCPIVPPPENRTSVPQRSTHSV